jgi:hypothetical protein
MNSLYKNNSRRLVLATLLIVAGQLMSGCSKDKEADVVVPGDGTNLSVSVLGVTDEEELAPSELKANAAGRAAVKQSAVLPGKIQAFKDFDAQTTLERNTLGKKISISSTGKGTSNGLMAAAVAVDVKYLLVLYKADGTFVSSTVMSSGTATNVKVQTSTAYNWYAVSYNSAVDVPDLGANSLALKLPGGKDVLYAKGSINIPEAGAGKNTSLGILFKHSLARVAVELNTMGMFADMVTAGVTVSGVNLKTATLDLKTGALTDPVAYTQPIDYSSFTNTDPQYADSKIAYLYTVDNTAAVLNVTINALSIKLDDGSTRPFSALATTPARFTFSLTPQLGASYTARANLLESPVTLDGVRWSRANLYYTAGHNPYRFNHKNTHTNARNTYFSYGAVTPDNYGRNSDPCALVYPAGVWRQASIDDYNTIVGGLFGVGRESANYGSGTLGYVEFQNTTGTAGPYPSKNLRFNFNGESVSVNVVNNLLEIGLGSTYGVNGAYWTSSPAVGLPPLLSLGAYHFQASNNSFNTNTALLNIGLLGSVEVAQTGFRNVRCVRTAGN